MNRRHALLALSTPFGRQGWFWREWATGTGWERHEVPWSTCPRISPEFIERERASLGDAWVEQEYACSFESLTGLVYPNFAQAWADSAPPSEGEPVGGIDFGWRNPFAAVWGVRTRDDVLWLTGERYLARAPQPTMIQIGAPPRSPAAVEDPVCGMSVVREGALQSRWRGVASRASTRLD